ncbi:hypothetical protein NKR74_12480 [Bacillus sp. 3103sda1]|uniref:hypothetical protein n=1 Tax=Bacillus sp. 3103sda1 TaxID=2953808 RepID=UPI0020A06178|nr:hypothetical protein [Bacillus sp. 3103sda1]MCP1124121.1 hypothetical protein [Bacillus sp. 3103sda1]
MKNTYLFLLIIVILLLSSCSNESNKDNSQTNESNKHTQQEDEYMKNRKTFNISSEKLFTSIKNKEGIKKTFEKEGSYNVISDKNIIQAVFLSESEKVSSVEVTVNNRNFYKNEEEKKIVLRFFKDLFESLDINYDEEKLLSILKEDLTNSADIKNTDYKYFNYNDQVWLSIVGVFNNGEKKGSPTGINININKNKPEAD